MIFYGKENYRRLERTISDALLECESDLYVSRSEHIARKITEGFRVYEPLNRTHSSLLFRLSIPLFIAYIAMLFLIMAVMWVVSGRADISGTVFVEIYDKWAERI